MQSLRHFALFALAGSLILTSCSKDEDAATPTPAPSNNNNNNNSSGPPTPVIAGADGFCWAVKSITSETVAGMTFNIEVGLGVAGFANADHSGYIPAGSVSLNATALTLQSGSNAYVNTITATEPTGIDFSSGTNWDVVGNTDVPTFTRSITSIPFPDCDTVNSSTTVVRANGYTLTTSYVTGADSVIFTVGGVTKTLAGNANSCTFTATELSGVGTGTNIVQITPWNYTSETIGGELIYFGKEIVQTHSVTIQ